MAENLLHFVQLNMGSRDVLAVGELLAGLELSFSSWTDAEAGRGYIRVYAADSDAAATLLTSMRACIAEWTPVLEGECSVVQSSLRDEDWTEVWKRYFHAFRASRRLVVKPTWETYASEPGDVVLELDPGMSFGTGYHGTTRACLEYIDELALSASPGSLVDAGCGSGILTIAAARLGYSPIVAFDNDPQAAAVARENCRLQGVDPAIVTTGDVATPPVTGEFDVVVANILAPVLIAHASAIVSLSTRRPNSRLVLSGILHDQYDDVLKRYVAAGFVEVSRKSIDEWTSGCLRPAT